METRDSAIEVWGADLPTSAISVGRVTKFSSDAKVYSPMTSATATKAADMRPEVMLGTTIRVNTVGQPAPSERAASDNVTTLIADSAESIER